MESWGIIPNYENYEASGTGEVRKKDTKTILKKSIRNCYFAVSLNVNGKSKIFSVHRLVAMTFHKNPENKPTVDHIDRNKLNNHKDNLRWADYKEQRVNRNNKKSGMSILMLETNTKEIIKEFNSLRDIVNYVKGKESTVYKYVNKSLKNENLSAYGYLWKYKDEISLIGEIWKLCLVNDKDYYVSNFGRVRHKDKIIKLFKGYDYLSFDSNVSVHRCVAKAFIPNPENLPIVNHKNGNKTDNRAENLEWTTISKNSLHSVNTGLVSKVKKIVHIDKNGNETIYNSGNQASKALNIDHRAIGRCCQGKIGKVLKGERFRYLDKIGDI